MIKGGDWPLIYPTLWDAHGFKKAWIYILMRNVANQDFGVMQVAGHSWATCSVPVRRQRCIQ